MEKGEYHGININIAWGPWAVFVWHEFYEPRPAESGWGKAQDYFGGNDEE